MIGKFIPIGGGEGLSYRKEFNIKTMKSHGANGYVGLREDGEDYHVDTKYWKFEPVWNGEGLPPVGVEFEYGTHRTRAKCLGVGHHMIFASKGNPDDEEGNFEEFMISIFDSEFHIVRTEADRKRYEFANACIEIDRKGDYQTVMLSFAGYTMPSQQEKSPAWS